MSALRTLSRGSRTAVALTTAVLLTGVLSSCTEDSSGAGGDADVKAGEEAPEVSVSTNLGKARGAVPLTKPVKVKASHGTLKRVVASTSEGAKLSGSLNAARTAWTLDQRLEPGTTYTLRSVARSADGKAKHSTTKFSTVDLSLDEQTYASIAPLDGETVGVGMPVVVNFDVPVTDRAAIEKHMKVTSTPQQKGTWHWLSDNEVHWRPATYWKPGTEVTVDVDINSVPAGNGIFGQESRTMSFDVGDSVISKVDTNAHTMKTFINGSLARTMPITVGKDGFTTRSGVKVIMAKHRSKRMNSETVGIEAGDPEAYDIADVEYAMRLTHSGEFIHAAPWSVGSQGAANVSHGCTGMSTSDAGWLYGISKRGDVVEYTGTDRPMTLENGYGDWNLPFPQYAEGSSL